MDNIAIDVKNVSVKFNLAMAKYDGLKEYVINLIKGRVLYQEFQALKDVSFQVAKGEALGIVGFNGSGKSTLLKVIAGILRPDSGKAKVYGSIAPLIELGAGFDHNLTAKENIFVNGAHRAIPRKKIQEKYDEIVDFAELHDFIDVPIKNFSSGMRARLGFAAAIMFDPDVLIADEVLSTGDYKFKAKCETKINQMRKNGLTILFVSHHAAQVKNVCSKAIWLDKGQIKMHGNTDEVCKAYENSNKK